MAIGIIEMLILLVVLSGIIGVPILMVIAVAKGRPGLATAILGGTFLLVVGLGIFAALFATVVSHRPTMTNAPIHMGGPVMDAAQMTSDTFQHTQSMPSEIRTSWDISFAPVLFVACGVVALLILAVRRMFSQSTTGGHGRIWPAFLALPLIAFFFIGSVRYHKSTSHNSEQAANQSRMFQQKQLAIAKKAAAMAHEVQTQIESMDIHQLMDKFDAPRIALQAPAVPTAAPAIMVIAAAAQAEATPTAEAPLNSQQEKSPSKRKRFTKSPSAPPAAVKVADTVAVANISAPPTPPVPPASAATAEKPPGARPAWIKETPKRTGNTRRDLIATEEYETEDECYRAADVYLMLKTYEHLMQLVGRPTYGNTLPSITFRNDMILADGQIISAGASRGLVTDPRMRQLIDMGIGIDYLRREIVAKDPQDHESREYIEDTVRSVGPMKKLYMQIEFTPSIDRELRQAWAAYNRQERFAVVGVGAASVLGLLSMMWGLLKVDTVTKGYYTKRLFIGVPVAIIGGVSLLALLFVA